MQNFLEMIRGIYLNIYTHSMSCSWMYTLNKTIKAGTNDNSTSIIVLQGRSDNGQSIHSGTSTDTSTIQEQ
jgi:hypothetical protein